MVQYTYSSHRTRQIDKIAKQRVAYPQVAKNIVDTSDIILEVLDTRFVKETRNTELETEIEKQGKKIIYVLNKADLVKPSALREIRGTLYPYTIVSCIKREGIKDLRMLIKRVAKTIEKREKREILKDRVVQNDEMLNKIKVGVIGYPNAGKSSLLNLLAGKSAAGVGADAGFTRNVQKIKLSDDILLIDAPGVIPGDQYSEIDKEKIAEHSLAGGKSYTQVKEPDLIVFQLFRKYPDELKSHYNVEAEDSDDLIEEVGRQKGFLKKGGIVNENSAAREILRAWQMGEIKVGKSKLRKSMFEDEEIVHKFAEREQNVTHGEVSEIIDILAIDKMEEKLMPVHIADLFAGSHADRYHELFTLLKENKENKVDWVDSSDTVIELAKQYLEEGNLKRRMATIDFRQKDVIKYLKDLPNEELDIILVKFAFNYISNLEEFFELISKKLKVDGTLIATIGMKSPVIQSISDDARFYYKGKAFPYGETRTLKEGEEFKMKYFNESKSPESGFMEGAEVHKFYHSKEKIEELADKYGLEYFIGNWKEYTGQQDSDMMDYDVLILQKRK